DPSLGGCTDTSVGSHSHAVGVAGTRPRCRKLKATRQLLTACVGLWLCIPTLGLAAPAPAAAKSTGYDFNDSHFHLTNYIQEGITAKQFLGLMGTRVGRSTLFGIPLQQQWSYRVSGDDAPTYYLDTDAPLYYYSFTDAYVAMQYRSL